MRVRVRVTVRVRVRVSPRLLLARFGAEPLRLARVRARIRVRARVVRNGKGATVVWLSERGVSEV